MSVRRSHEELTVITKTYDLILLWSCHHTGKFPRNHRFVLGERIERNLYDLLETLIQAKYTRQRREFLEQANLLLEILRFQMQSAKDLWHRSGPTFSRNLFGRRIGNARFMKPASRFTPIPLQYYPGPKDPRNDIGL
jgi:hypothetical protein